jgi:ATP-binding cassette subfamily C protein
MDLFLHFKRCLNLLTLRGKIVISLVSFAQCLIGFLDLIGVFFIIILVSSAGKPNIASTGVQLPDFVSDVFSHVDNPGIMILLVIAVFSAKSVFAFVLHSVFIRRLGFETNRVIKDITDNLFIKRKSDELGLTSHQASFSIFESTEVVFMETLSPLVILIADTFLVILILINILLTGEVIFLPTILYFSLVFIFLRVCNSHFTKGVYERQVGAALLSKALIQETFYSLKELTVSQKTSSFVRKILETRAIGVASAENISIARLIPKYVYEMALFGGIALIAFVSSRFSSSDSVVPLVTLFLVSSSRMIPSFLRIQYYLGVVQKSAAQSETIFGLLERSISESRHNSQSPHNSKVGIAEDFQGHITLSDVTFTYDKKDSTPSLTEVNLEIGEGTSVAIVGKSGSGKSTLLNIILGFYVPNHGNVKISGLSPHDAFTKWPGEISYIPQRITIYNDTLLSNVAVGVDEKEVSIERVSRILERVGLDDTVLKLPLGLHTLMGELGSRLSGGQIQRLGLARALYSNPKLLILDEATSALDAESEEKIITSLLSESGLTLLMISHRLQSIQNVDYFVYLENGLISAKGSLGEVLSVIPDLESQIISTYSTDE